MRYLRALLATLAFFAGFVDVHAQVRLPWPGASAACTFGPVTFDGATVASVTLSNCDLTATNTGTTGTNQGAHTLTSAGKSTGKFYFEGMPTYGLPAPSDANYGIGIGTTASTFTNLGNSATTGNLLFKSGTLWASGASTGVSLGGWSSADVYGIAADFDNHRIWFKRVNNSPGNWNNNGSADPATNVGGQTISAGTFIPFAVFGGTNGMANRSMTLNVGGSAFVGAVPSGFTAGWTP